MNDGMFLVWLFVFSAGLCFALSWLLWWIERWAHKRWLREQRKDIVEELTKTEDSDD